MHPLLLIDFSVVGFLSKSDDVVASLFQARQVVVLARLFVLHLSLFGISFNKQLHPRLQDFLESGNVFLVENRNVEPVGVVGVVWRVSVDGKGVVDELLAVLGFSEKDASYGSQ